MSLPPVTASRSFRGVRRTPRALLWLVLVALLVIAQTLLVWLSFRYEEARALERSEDAAAVALGEVRRRMQQLLQDLQALQPAQRSTTPAAPWQAAAEGLLRQHREIGRVEWRDTSLRVEQAGDSPYREPLFARWPRAEMQLETELACGAARRTMTPVFSRSQFVPLPGGLGAELVDVCVPVQLSGRLVGFTVASVVLPALLEELNLPAVLRSHELSFVEGDGARLARSGVRRGLGVYRADSLVDLPGSTLRLRVDSVAGPPSLIPNLATALVLDESVVAAAA